MFKKKVLSALSFCMMSCFAWGQSSIPMQLVNNSSFKDSEIYVGILGMENGRWIYYDLSNNSASNTALRSLNSSVNTLHKQTGDQGYVNIFTTLDKVKDKTIHIGHTNGCRLLVGFRSPMYLHAFDNGYAGADLNNPSDPNANIRWENLEFTYDQYNVVFANTTRVDCFQYPMGVEVYGTATSNNAYMKAGETANYKTITDDFQNEFKGTDFAACYKNSVTADNLGGIIVNPSKVASIRDNFFTDEINKIWNYFKSHTLTVELGNFGKWTGKIAGDNYFSLQRTTDGASVRIAQPSSKDIIECSGTMATGSDNEKQFEAQLCGAINRGAVDLTEQQQAWQNTANFFRDGTVYNPYVKFLHRTDLTYNGYTYAFAYDDTGDNSATVATKDPDRLVVTIGGFAADPGVEPDKPSKGDDDNPTEPSEPVDDNAYDYNSSCNLWKNANVSYDFYYAPAWNKIANPAVTADNGTYTFTFPSATDAQWQAQAWLTTDLQTNTVNKYDFSVTLKSSTDIDKATAKLYVRGNDGDFYFTDNVNLKANTPTIIKHQGMAGRDMTNISLLLDFGGNPANTVITVSKPVLKETSCTPTGISSIRTTKAASNGEWYDLSGRKISNKKQAPGIYIHNGKKVVVNH